MSLVSEKCEACHVGSPSVTDEEIAELSPQVPERRIIEEGSIRKLRRTLRFPDFAEALAFTNTVGELAEHEGHRPRLTTEWPKVTATWWTQAINNPHRNDFVMAAKTDHVTRGGH